jgi:hypothetical protein
VAEEFEAAVLIIAKGDAPKFMSRSDVNAGKTAAAKVGS